ncbi:MULTISPECIES: hypothetical protein [Paenibacillus]|uniref:hypothetical protein n=1 Tax=Paenibacillus TaxID=44249 RepID=UPI00117ED376|nr:MULTISPECIES: hypothetical protein [Paenibacillus]
MFVVSGVYRTCLETSEQSGGHVEDSDIPREHAALFQKYKLVIVRQILFAKGIVLHMIVKPAF